jgi:hypothetical protein
MDKCKNLVIQRVIHRRQNPLESTGERLSTCKLLRKEETSSLHLPTHVGQKRPAGEEPEMPLPDQRLSRFRSNTVISTTVEKL